MLFDGKQAKVRLGLMVPFQDDAGGGGLIAQVGDLCRGSVVRQVAAHQGCALVAGLVYGIGPQFEHTIRVIDDVKQVLQQLLGAGQARRPGNLLPGFTFVAGNGFLQHNLLQLQVVPGPNHHGHRFPHPGAGSRDHGVDHRKLAVRLGHGGHLVVFIADVAKAVFGQDVVGIAGAHLHMLIHIGGDASAGNPGEEVEVPILHLAVDLVAGGLVFLAHLPGE